MDVITERVETFDLTIKDVGGTYHSAVFDLDIGCTLVNLTYTPVLTTVWPDPMGHTNTSLWTIPATSNVEPGYPNCYKRVNTIENLTANVSFSGPIAYWDDLLNCNINNISCDVLMFDMNVINYLYVVPGDKVLITFNITTQISPQEFRTSSMFTFEACHYASTEIALYWHQTYDYLQIVADGPSDGYFTSRIYQTTHADCPVIHLDVSADKVNYANTLPGMIGAPYKVAGGLGEWRVPAENRSLHGIY